MPGDHPVDLVKDYERFFGFSQPPFSLAPNTRFRFESTSHEAALSQVTYALQRREPVVMVTGEIGTGKTLLCRTVIERLERKTFVSVIDDPLLERDDLLKQMLQDFGVISSDRTKLTPTSRHDLIHALQQFLSSLAPLGAHAVVIIDEAQHVQPDVLEHIRLVSNIQDERGSMLQIVLVGQSDLEPLLSRPELRQLRQRVSRSITLEPLAAVEVARYIDHRLAVARDTRTPSEVAFTPEAIGAVSQLSRGIPRLINLLCDRALEAAYAQRARAVDASSVNTAAAALKLSDARLGAPPETARPAFDPPRPPPPVASHAKRNAMIAVSIALAASAIWFGVRTMSQTRRDDRPAQSTVARPPAATQPAAPPPPITVPPANVASAPVVESTGETFEIVIASFRTAARATEVANQVGALGQPVRQRSSGGWQQVLAGPFASKAAADDAQERLDRAGFTGTEIVRVAR